MHARTRQLLDRRLLEEVALGATWANARFHFAGMHGLELAPPWTRCPR